MPCGNEFRGSLVAWLFTPKTQCNLVKVRDVLKEGTASKFSIEE
jgi:hypothetical protein